MKDTSALISELGYRDSPHYLTTHRVRSEAAYSLASRRLIQAVHLHGTYVLREPSSSAPESCIPVVYVLEAESEEAAERAHRAVWNQNLVPFLLIRTPRAVRLCAGFRFRSAAAEAATPELRGLLDTVEDWMQVLERLADFHARRIDDGTLWRQRGRQVTPETRVDKRLLVNLDELNRQLLQDGLSRRVAHALIGKYIFLRYLRDREILSHAKLEAWSLRQDDVFGRNAKMKSVRRLFNEVDTWLNGSVFPLPFTGESAPNEDHIRRVTAALLGDDPRSGQMHLPFDVYDFSFIPIETLSTIYQKMLHAQEGKGRELGAYYTPLPLVNFTLSELEAIRPLKRETKVFDPACGSGAFLVQCYRRLVERRIRDSGGRIPSLEELKKVLVEQVFGVDADEGACRMAQLSLVLTMLDYADPEDLRSRPDFKLPSLYDTNIQCSDYFAPALEVDRRKQGFDWVVGNPPWFKVNGLETPPEQRSALEWLRSHEKDCPVADNQIAEAFAWRVTRHLAEGGVAGLLLPAMTLFKDRTDFRKSFFQAHRIYSVANFSNLAPYLFLDAATGAAALFFSPSKHPDAEIPVFSPMLANQQALLSAGPKEAWSITVDHSEIQLIPAAKAREGGALTWKLAMWGTARDERLLERVSQRYPSLRNFLVDHRLQLAEGPQLKSTQISKGSNRTRFVEEFIGLRTFDTRMLAGLHVIPRGAMELISRQHAHARVRGGLKVLEARLFKPPHVLVGGTGEFAIFSEDLELVAPSRHLVIGGEAADAQVLKALALFLNSDFARYHRCFVSPQWGVRGGRSTMATLENLPVPLGRLSRRELADWERLHKELVEASSQVAELPPRERKHRLREDARHARCLERLNQMSGELLGLSDEERQWVEDFVHVRSRLVEGLAPEAVRPPDRRELEAYALVLKSNLDAFLDADLRQGHEVLLMHDDVTGLVRLELVNKGDSRDVCLVDPQDPQILAALESMREQMDRVHGQWMYFARNLRVYHGRQTLLLKPMQRFWWTRSQAVMDADDVIAEMLLAEGGD